MEVSENTALLANKKPSKTSKSKGKSSKKQAAANKEEFGSLSVSGGGKKVAFSNVPSNSSFSTTSSSSSTSLKPTEKAKRISFALRGQRKSSFADIQSAIHVDIAPADFHKHVNAKLPDPLRLRQIIVYAMSHEIATNRAKTAAEMEGTQFFLFKSITKSDRSDDICECVAKNVIDRVMQMMLEKKLSTSWFSRPRSVDEGVVVTLPNPVNDELRARVAGYRQVVKQLNDNMQDLELSKPSSADLVEWDVSLGVDHESVANPVLAALDKDADVTKVADVETTIKQVDNIHKNLSLVRKYSAIKSVELQSNFAKVIDACWQKDSEDDLDDLLQPFNAVHAKAGRRLSFNLQKNDEPIKVLRALATHVEEEEQ